MKAKNIKRIMSFSLAACMVFSLTACGGKGEKKELKNGENQEVETAELAFPLK